MGYIDPAVAGTAMPAASATVERGQLRLFATATGQNDPVYCDVDAARAAGHPDLPVPPTFLFGLEMSQSDAFGHLATLGVDLGRVLHGEQSFVYHDVAHAGDTLVFTPRIGEVYTKKGGALEFMSREITVAREDGSAVAELSTVLVVQHPEVTA